MAVPFSAIAPISSGQQGRISHAQLLAAGAERHQIKRWGGDGRLHLVCFGVYAVGHTAPSQLADLWTAYLAGGDGAVISHRSAAHVLRILHAAPHRIDITVPRLAGRRRAGIMFHRVRALHPDDTTTFCDIPITTPERVLLDLSPRLGLSALARACHEAWIHHGTTPDDVEGCIARNLTKKGIPKLRRALGNDVTLSELETGFLKLLRRHRLPLPRTNVNVAGDKVDCHWEHVDLTIELLSYRFHASRRAFEDDVARRRRSSHIAYTWGDVFERGAQTARELRGLLQDVGLSSDRPAS